MNGIYARSIILASEVATKRVVIGPWEAATPGAAVLLDNCSPDNVMVYIEGAEHRDGPYFIGYGSGSPIALVPGGRVITALGFRMDNSKVSKFIGFRLGSALNIGLVKIHLVGFAPLAESQMPTPEVGAGDFWWH